MTHTCPSPLESQKLSVSDHVGRSDSHFQMKFPPKKFHLTVDWMWI